MSEAIERCIIREDGELPPVPGHSYVAFVVHPRQAGAIALAIAHKDGDTFVVDLCRDGLTVQQAADLAKAYGISEVTGADDEGDGSVSLAHAVCGAINLLQQERWL
jgi:hypothetical protein